MKPVWEIWEATLTFVGECTLILLDSFKKLFVRPLEWRETLSQMAFIGVSSLPIVLLTSFFSGAVLCLYLAQFLSEYGVTNYLGATIGLSATREIIPVLTGVTVAARCGSAMAAQIGTMAVTEQLDALEMLGVPPTKFLAGPRIISSILMMPALALCGVFASIYGAYLVAQGSHIPGMIFLNGLQQFTGMRDLIGGLIKAPVFGMITALVACQQGFRTKAGAVGVGKATTNTVVLSIVLIYVADFFLAKLLF